MLIYLHITKPKAMKTLKELQQELKDLEIAYSKNYLTVNEYCEMYLALSKKIKSIK